MSTTDLLATAYRLVTEVRDLVDIGEDVGAGYLGDGPVDRALDAIHAAQEAPYAPAVHQLLVEARLLLFEDEWQSAVNVRGKAHQVAVGH